MSWRLITSDADLAATVDNLTRHGAVAVDTEFMRRNTFYPQVALLQLCVADEALLIDPLAVSDLEPLRGLMTSPEIVKVLHSCSEDLEVFHRWLGVLPQPLVDTQRAAALLGDAHGLGYRAVVEHYLGIELEKGETRSDWLRRPLTESQCHYAAQDVIHLLPVWSQLEAKAEVLDRIGWIMEEGEELCRAFLSRERSPYRRVKGAGKLSRRETACLEALCDWREERARAVDKPRGWILDDKACVTIAQAMPGHREALAALDVLPPSVLRRQGDRLLECVAKARSLEEADLPPPAAQPLSREGRSKLQSLKARVRDRADTLGVAPELLLPAADLELLVREAEGEAIEVPPRWHGWRAEAVLSTLRGKAG